MTEIEQVDKPAKRSRKWAIIAVTTVLALVSTVGFAAANDGLNFRRGGGEGRGAVLACPGGMSTLAHTFGEGITTVFVGDPEVMVEIVNTIPVDFFLLEKVTTGTHGGTHLDAPRHFLEDGRSVDELHATEFVWPAYVIDVRDRVIAEGPNFELTRDDIKAYEDEYGKIRWNSLVIIQTGHEGLFGSAAYTGIPHPGFSAAAVKWLVNHRQIKALGSDGLGPDASMNTDFSATYEILANDGVAIPGMANLDSLLPKGDLIMAPAVPLEGGSGFQVQPLACHGRRN